MTDDPAKGPAEAPAESTQQQADATVAADSGELIDMLVRPHQNAYPARPRDVPGYAFQSGTAAARTLAALTHGRR
jgi:hypothetical protein